MSGAVAGGVAGAWLLLNSSDEPSQKVTYRVLKHRPRKNWGLELKMDFEKEQSFKELDEYVESNLKINKGE